MPRVSVYRYLYTYYIQILQLSVNHYTVTVNFSYCLKEPIFIEDAFDMSP